MSFPNFLIFPDSGLALSFALVEVDLSGDPAGVVTEKVRNARKPDGAA